MSRLQPVTTINMSARLASASWITKSPTGQRVVFGALIKPTLWSACWARGQCVTASRASLHRSRSERRHATARGPSRTGHGNLLSAMRR